MATRQKTRSGAKADTDSPWKEAIEKFFDEFMLFFFPHAHAAINWKRRFEFLDKELQKVVRDAAIGRSYADKLVKVYLKDGGELWILIHIEIQSQKDRRFELRMYVYNYRLFDRYRRSVVSLAILADDNPAWRPCKYGYSLLGCEAGLTFPTVKLLDYRAKLTELENSKNPIAVLVFAHLKAKETHRDMNERFTYRRKLLRNLLRSGRMTRHTVRELLRLVDWLMPVSDNLERRLDRDIERIEKEERMPFVGSLERVATRRGLQRGMEKGLQKGRQEGLQKGLQKGRQEGLQRGAVGTAREYVLEILNDRFEKIPRSTMAAIKSIDDLERLKDLRRAATIAPTLKDFLDALN